MTIVFDLDGTLIDASVRMYTLFQRLVPESRLTKEEYWELKRDKVSHQALLKRLFPSRNYAEFQSAWMQRIELPDYLAMDYCYPETIEVLEKLAASNEVVLLTARQSKQGLLSELGQLRIDRFFDSVLVTEGKVEKLTLATELRLPVESDNGRALFIGDMGKDIELGRAAGGLTIAVSHGFMDAKHLASYKPDFIVDDLCAILGIVEDIAENRTEPTIENRFGEG